MKEVFSPDGHATMLIMHDFESRAIGDADNGYSNHITLAPYFDAPAEAVPAIVDAVRYIASETEPFEIYPDGHSLYGNNESIPVVKIADPSNGLYRLHERYMDAISDLGCCFNGLRFTRRRYSPHTRWLEFTGLNRHFIDSVSVVKFPSRILPVRSRIFEVISLGSLTDGTFDSHVSQSLVQ